MIDSKSRDQEIIFYNLSSKLHDQLGQVKKSSYSCGGPEELYRLLLSHKNDKAKPDTVSAQRNCSVDISESSNNGAVTKEENKEE